MQIFTPILAFTGIASALALPVDQKEHPTDTVINGLLKGGNGIVDDIIDKITKAQDNHNSIKAGHGDLPASGPTLVILDPVVVHVTRSPGGGGTTLHIQPDISIEKAMSNMEMLEHDVETWLEATNKCTQRLAGIFEEFANGSAHNEEGIILGSMYRLNALAHHLEWTHGLKSVDRGAAREYPAYTVDELKTNVRSPLEDMTNNLGMAKANLTMRSADMTNEQMETIYLDVFGALDIVEEGMASLAEVVSGQHYPLHDELWVKGDYEAGFDRRDLAELSSAHDSESQNVKRSDV